MITPKRYGINIIDRHFAIRCNIFRGGYGMKAEDTVMNPIQLSERIQYFPDWDLARGNQFIEELCYYIARSQAEITFRAGINEVVDWMKENITWDWPNDELLFSSWLKERGL